MGFYKDALTNVLTAASSFTKATADTLYLKLTGGTLTGNLTVPKVITGVVYPTVDSVTAIQLNKADGTTNVLNVDTTNSRVGIGTTSPTLALDVNGSINTYNNVVAGYNTTIPGLFSGGSIYPTGNAQSFSIYNGGSAASYIQLFGSTNATPNIIKFVTGNSERVRIDATGNVGIGTVSPTQKLSLLVSDTNGYDGLTISDGITNAYYLTANNTALWNTSVWTGFAIGTGTNVPLNIATNGTSRIWITAAGNVGIGTTTPQTTLDINGGMRTVASAKSAAYQLLITDSTVYVTTGVTVGMAITLPAASANTIGLYFFIYKVDAGVGTVAITPTGTDTINGVNAAKNIANQWNGALVRGLTATSWLATSFTGL